MKKRIILTTLVGLLCYVVLQSRSGGPAAIAGAGVVDGCTGGSCHNSSATLTTGVTIQLLDGATPVTTYIAGNSYTIKVTGTQGSGSLNLTRFGYQLAVLNSSLSSAGTLTAPSGSHVTTLGSVSYVEHSSPLAPTTGTGTSGTTYVVNIPWTAPSSGSGNVNVKTALNAVNFDGSSAGDAWNTQALAVQELGTIGGPSSLCLGTTITLTNSATGGNWTSTTTGVATIGISNGVVSPVTPGTTTISYTAGGNTVTKIITVNPNPTAIGGTFSLCQGGTTTLGSTGGSTWSSSTTSVATIDAGGVVTGVVTGSTSVATSTITYTNSSGCFVTQVVSVNPPGTITGGATSVCVGASTTYTGSPAGGTWSSSASGTASVNSSGVVTGGATTGTATITYTPTTGCIGTRVISVNAVPVISGASSVCNNSSTTLGAIPSGGAWTGSSSIATVSGLGVVTGTNPGNTTITYTRSGCTTTAPFTVNPTPGSTITGSLGLCVGATSSLGNSVSGGTWASSTTSVANVNSSGVVNAVAVGTSTITYTLTGGCFTTAVVTVSAAPGAIGGSLTACVGGSTTLTNTATGGTWTSSASAVATIGSSSGVVNGLGVGTSSITYSLGAGCTATAEVTVTTGPAPITGPSAVCEGASVTMSTTTSGVTWSTSNAAVAIVDGSGVVTGISAGAFTITCYGIGGCFVTKAMTVNPIPAAIGGSLQVCMGSTSLVTNASGGGSWSSATTSVATINSGGTLSGISVGTSVISYTFTSTGCFRTDVATVNPLPAAIVGASNICLGATTTFTNSSTGGTWMASNTRVTINSSTGEAMGSATGPSIITYTLPTGCRATTTTTVNPMPNTISGSTVLCVNATGTLTNSVGGGTWISGNSGVATVGLSSGAITGVSAGTADVTYTLSTGCNVTGVVSVNPLPSAITGAGAAICPSATITLSSATGGGTWTSGTTSVATIGSSDGIVLGITGGTSNITYTLATGCRNTATVTVNSTTSAGTISGTSSICVSQITSLSSTVAGGTWASSNTSVATIGSSNGVVNGASAGTVNFTYTVTGACGTATAVHTMTVTNTAVAGTFTGPSTVCLGSTATLSNSVTGGTWISDAPGIASVNLSTGIVSGNTTGTANITYTVSGSCGIATAIMIITVNPQAPAITGTALVCEASVITLTATGGGTWSSSNTGVATTPSTSGTITGVSQGTSTITYTLPTGCFSSRDVTVNPLPAGIGGNMPICPGGSVSLNNTTGGGVWLSSPTSIATVDISTGVVTGVNAGTATVSYVVSSTGCVRATTVTVNPLPATITGTGLVCEGGTMALSSTPLGGTWISTNIIAADVDVNTGLVSGITPGTATISYTLATGCARSTIVTVNAQPDPIAGTLEICVGSTRALSSAPTGGTWSSSFIGVATVDITSGVVTGVSMGVTTITYTAPSTCIATAQMTINAAPAAISGALNVCPGTATTLSHPDAGGVWTSSNTFVATVASPDGVIAGVAQGTSNISYMLPTGCSVGAMVTVNPIPPAIGGSSTVCEGSSTTLNNTLTGGTWASADIAVATIGSSSGIVSGAAAGNTTITYTSAPGCVRTTTITVNPLPAAIVGTPSVCIGNTTTLANTTLGGTWNSGTPATASIGGSTGIVSGLVVGTSRMSYTIGTGCRTTVVVTVNPLPSSITGTSTVCEAATVTLSSASTGGSWSTGSTNVSVGSGSGIVSGVTAGTGTVTYTLPTGCKATKVMTISPLPVAATISGLGSVCEGSSITLTVDATGGTWNSGDANITMMPVTAATQQIHGLSAGSATVTYTMGNSCGTITSMKSITVVPLPDAGVVTGNIAVCVGYPVTFTSTSTGGTWSHVSGSSTVSTGGLVSGVTPGMDTIFYTVTTVCGTDQVAYPIAILPAINAGFITGKDSVCQGDTIILAPTIWGGIWSTTDVDASVSFEGVVTGITGGTAVISYSVSNACSVDTVHTTITVLSAAQCALSVKTITEASLDLNVYPNPSAGNFTVEIPATYNGAIIIISDVLGRVVDTRTLTASGEQKAIFELNNIPAGNYVVRVNADNKTYRKKLLIVK